MTGKTLEATFLNNDGLRRNGSLETKPGWDQGRKLRGAFP